MIQDCEQIEKIIKSLKNLFQAANGKKEKVDLKMCIDDSLYNCRQILTESPNISVRVDIPENLYLFISMGSLLIIISNLILNSAHALSDIKEGWIKISINFTDKQIVLNISDNGAGIPEKDVQNIFEKWYTTDQRHNMGFGLYLTKMLCEKYQWKINVSSMSGHTTFSVTIPRN